MILTKSSIMKEIKNKKIVLDPYHEEQLGPNSYNLQLYNELLVYDEVVLDPKKKNKTKRIRILPHGYTLEPGVLYLGRTLEYTETHTHVPLIEGRSSWARLGLSVHVSAGFGDVGFCGHWTLEMTVVQPMIIYPFVQIAQIYYHTVDGAISKYDGKYHRNDDIQPSKMWEELATVVAGPGKTQ